MNIDFSGVPHAGEDFYEKSDIRQYTKLKLTPFFAVAFNADSSVKVSIEDAPAVILSMPESTIILALWLGEWSSRNYWFTAGEFQSHIRLHPKSPYQKI